MSRRFRPVRRRAALVWLVLAALVALRIWQDPTGRPPPENLAEGWYRVRRVVDGDTLLLTNGARIRLLGVDAPEIAGRRQVVERWGPQAADFARRLVGSGQVQLQFDRERLDRYQRFLAYVWVEGKLLNEELVRQGLATAELEYRYSQSMKNRLRRAEDEAKAARRGIWSAGGGSL